MKKLLLLLSVLLAGVSGAWADKVTSLTDGNLYTIDFVSQDDTKTWGITASGTTVSAVLNTTGSVFVAHSYTNENGDTRWIFVNNSDGYYLAYAKMTSTFTIANAENEFSVTNLTKGYNSEVTGTGDYTYKIFITNGRRGRGGYPDADGCFILNEANATFDNSSAPYYNGTYTSALFFTTSDVTKSSAAELAIARFDALYPVKSYVSSASNMTALFDADARTFFSTYESSVNSAATTSAITTLSTSATTTMKSAEGKKFYAVNNDLRGNYLTIGSSNVSLKDNSSLTIDAIMEVEYAGNGKYYLKGVNSKKYAGAPSNPPSTYSDKNDATAYFIGNYANTTDNTVYFAKTKKNATDEAFHYNSEYTTWVTNWKYSTSPSQWIISPVSDEEYAALTSPVEETLNYTLTDVNGKSYSGTYNGYFGTLPTLTGCYGYSLTDPVWNFSTKTVTATVNFPFNVSSNSVNNPTTLKSKLGGSLWYAADNGTTVKARRESKTRVYDVYADNYRWYIYPSLNENEEFYFKLYNVGAAKYIPKNPSTNYNSPTTLTSTEGDAGSFCFSHYKQGEGFNTGPTTTYFLTINSDGGSDGTIQNIWLWSGGTESASHTGSVMSFPELTPINVNTTFAALKSTTKFDILDESTVMGPGEFANPTDINAAIDAAQEVADNAEAKIAFIESANGTKIQNYLNQVARYGALANIKITMSKEYGTLILPCPCTRIDGLDIYSCNSAEGDVLILTPVDGNYNQNVPYIIHATEGSKYTIIGWDKGSTATHTAGWLTGVLNSETDIPSGSYMLATNKSTGVQAFYQVSGSGVRCAINKCYLTVPSGGDVKAFLFDIDGQETSIGEIFDEKTEQGAIFNLAGQRMSRIQKGVNIVNGKKVLVK